MKKVKKLVARKKKDITLRDVVVHIQSMEERLSANAVHMEKRLTSNAIHMEKRLTAKIDENTLAIQDLNLRVTALDEDLTATIKDTMKIREHVGMISTDDR